MDIFHQAPLSQKSHTHALMLMLFASALLCFSIAALPTCSYASDDSAEAPLTNEQVISMLTAGIGEELVSQKIKSSPNVFDLRPQAMIELKKSNVSDAIIELMLKRQQELETQQRSKLSLAVQKLTDSDADVRDSAYIYLQRMGGPALRMLSSSLSSPRADLRAASAEALGRLADKESAPLLRSMLADNDLNVRLAAGTALASLRDETGRDIARKSVVAGVGGIEGALRLLGMTADVQSAGFIRLRLLDDMAESVRLEAAKALESMPSKETTAALLKALAEDQSLAVKTTIIDALAKHTDPTAFATLKKVCMQLPEARENGLKAIGMYPPAQSVPFLINSLGQPLKNEEKDLVVLLLRKLTGQHFGPNQAKWLLWLETNRDKLKSDPKQP